MIDFSEYLRYDETSTSCLTWKKDSSKFKKLKDTDAGTFASNGYFRVTLKGVTKPAHRVIWEFFNGEIPKGFIIDHIDRNPRNNKISNLRLTTVQNNTRNRSKVSGLTSAYKGVHYNKASNKWKAVIMVDYKQRFLGYFVCEKEAAEVYILEALELFGEFANTEKYNG